MPPPPVDLICGGFPCQDISNAGKRAGIDGERSGLWSEFARVVGLVRPRVIVVENVAALLGRGVERVLGDLAALGYDAEWSTLRASDVGAPHRRERLFVVAHANAGGCGSGLGNIRARQPDVDGRSEGLAHSGRVDRQRRGVVGVVGVAEAARGGEGAQRQRHRDTAGDGCPGATLADGNGHGCEGVWSGGVLDGERAPRGDDTDGCNGSWPMGDAAEPGRARAESWARSAGESTVGAAGAGGNGRSTESGLGRSSDGLPARLDRWPARPGEPQHAWEPPRTTTRERSIKPGGLRPHPTRAARLRALGNAVVPEVAFLVGEVIQRMLATGAP